MEPSTLEINQGMRMVHVLQFCSSLSRIPHYSDEYLKNLICM